MSDVISIADFVDEVESFDKKITFDTNIWLRIQGFYTDSRDDRSKKYSSLYKALIEREKPIVFLQVVLSEFVNVSVKALADRAGWTKADGKIHQNPDYQSWISDVSDDIFHVVADCLQVDDQFSTIKLDEVFDCATVSSMDFNDSLIASYCKRNDTVLVTDDADFMASDIVLVTANPKLLKPRK